MSETESIMHAAIICKNGMTMLGKSHADCFHKAHNTGVECLSAASCQGFYSSKGRFLSREEAAKIAYAYGQTKKLKSVLFSEDLWSKTDGGFHEYDYVKGYYKAPTASAEK